MRSPQTVLETLRKHAQKAHYQYERLYARYYLGMRVSEIAVAEDVDPSRVRDSIRRGLKQLAKYF